MAVLGHALLSSCHGLSSSSESCPVHLRRGGLLGAKVLLGDKVLLGKADPDLELANTAFSWIVISNAKT